MAKGMAFPNAWWWRLHPSDGKGWYTDRAYWGTIAFPDVDGDGKADLCARGIVGIYCQLPLAQLVRPVDPWGTEFSDARLAPGARQVGHHPVPGRERRRQGRRLRPR